MVDHISLVLWIISRGYVVNKEVVDFTLVADFTFLTLNILKERGGCSELVFFELLPIGCTTF